MEAHPPRAALRAALPLCAALALLGACAPLRTLPWPWKARPKPPAPAPAPSVLHVTALAEPGANRDPEGRSLSVVVHLYQLREPEAFARLTFEEAASGHPEDRLLGRACVSRREAVLVPGTARTLEEPLSPDTRYVAGVALFRQPDPRAWRFLVDVAALEGNRQQGGASRASLVFRLQDGHLTLLEPAQGLLPGPTPVAPPGRP